MNICGHNAICMEESEPFGYTYPNIDSERCIDCGLCVKICPVNTSIQLNEPLKAFSAISRNCEDLLSSASGGASSVLSQVILNRGGIVYGCVQRNYIDIAHCRIDKPEDAYLIKGSKYVQSNIGYVYREVKKDLKDGKEVLFTGTPCQIAGLRAFLRHECENLYLVDLVCHGVPSQKLLREDVDFLLKDYPNVDVTKVCVEFRKKSRTKQEKFEPNYGTFLFINGDELNHRHPQKQEFLTDNYITAFMAGTILRENCYTCPYAQSQRSGDITIADFWGLKGESIPTTKGVSLMMPSTVKGLTLFNETKSYLQFEERTTEEAINGNGRLLHPSHRPDERDVFCAIYPFDHQKSYKLSLRKYKKEYHYKNVRPRIYRRYELEKSSNLILRILDKIPKFRGAVLKIAYKFAQFYNIVPK